MTRAQRLILSAAATFVLLAATPSMAATTCGVDRVDATDLDGVVYNPFRDRDTVKNVEFSVRGTPLTSVWARIETPQPRLDPNPRFESNTSSGGFNQVSGQAGSRPPTFSNLDTYWVRVALNDSGVAIIRSRLTLDKGANLRVGDYPMRLQMRIACGPRNSATEDSPMVIASNSLRVPNVLGAAEFNRNRINLGVMPIDNPNDWSGATNDFATLGVKSTGPFSIRLDNDKLMMRYVGASGGLTETTQIPYDLQIGPIRLSGMSGANRTIGCSPAVALSPFSNQNLIVRPYFQQNSAQGKRAGTYRDVITLTVSSSELAGASGEAGC